jgi:arylformamidase
MWIDLSQSSFTPDMPFATSLPAPEFRTVKDVEEDRINIQYYCTSTHVGTHVDAPRHFIEGGNTITDLPLDRFAGEAVVLDVSKDEPEEVTVADVEAAAADADGGVGEGDIVFLYAGWHEKYGTDAYDPHPWLSVPLAEWFVERGVKLVGVDTITPDIPGPHRPEGWIDFPVHRTLLGNGVLIAEHLANLAPYTGERLDVQGFPVKIHGGDGAPVRFVAKR